MLSPGAIISGFKRPSNVGPRLLRLETGRDIGVDREEDEVEVDVEGVDREARLGSTKRAGASIRIKGDIRKR
jgi:hypothetical protein